MQYPITVDGVPLDSLAYKITTRNGWQSTPGLRAASVEAAHTDGVLVPDRAAPLEPGQVAFSMFVRGNDWPEYVANLDTLKRLFSTPRGTIPVTMDTGEVVRVCQARTVASWQPEHVNPLHSRFTVVMEIPSGVWTTADYELRRYQAVSVTTPLAVDCWDPTAKLTDVQILIRDPGAAVEWTLSDAGVDTIERQRIWLQISAPAPLAADRSLLIDLGQWSATTIARPAAVDVDAAWFDTPKVTVTDLTGSIVRNGPMFGRSLLPLEPGGVLPPRVPAVSLDPVDGDDLPTSSPDVHVAMRPAWL
jgi:hypothetical protein